MPMIEVLVSDGRLDQPAKAKLADGLATILLRHQQAAPDSVTARAIAWVLFDERPARNLFVGGRPDADALRITVSVPSGSPSLLTKQIMFSEMSACATAALRGGANEDSQESALSIWCLLAEVPDGHWAAGGQVRRWRDVIRHVWRGDRALSRRQTQGSQTEGAQ